MNRAWIFLGFLAMSGQASARTWTDKTGRKVEAEFVSQNETAVLLKLPNGKEVSVPFSNLSAADLAHLIGLETGTPSKPKPDAMPGPGEEQPADRPADAPALRPAAYWTAALPVEAALPVPLVVEESKSGDRLVFASPNYRLVADSKLKLKVATNILEIFELTRVYCLALPLGLEPAFPLAGGKFEVTCYAQNDDSEKAGGQPGSAGTYDPGTGALSICLENMGLNPTGRALSGDLEDAVRTPIRSLVYQLSPQTYTQELYPWILEGLSMLITCHKYDKGKFDFRESIELVREKLLGMNLGRGEEPVFEKKILMPRLDDVLEVKRPHFVEPRKQAEYNGRCLLVVTYLLYMDDEGKGTGIRAGLQFMDESIKNQPTQVTAANQEEANKKIEEIQEKRKALPDEAHRKILRERSLDDVQADMAAAWKLHGLELIFPKADQ